MKTDHTWTLPGLTLRDITVDVPLDAADPGRGDIEIFARVVTAEGGDDRPYLVFLQGGPGSEAPRPTIEPANPSWLPAALQDFRVVMLDQRGTGRSTPVGLDTPLSVGGTLAGLTAAQRAEYLTHFRADEIVNDCEAVRQGLQAPRWSVLGQSFGGFTALRYLSAAAGSLAEVYFTGGLSAIGRSADEVYATTWETMVAKSESYYRRFPGDRDRMRELMQLAREGQIRLPNADRVDADRMRTVGHRIGMSGGAEQLHYLLEHDHRSPMFRHGLAGMLPFTGSSPIYAVLHESSYADGVVTDWSAERTMPDEVAEDDTLLGGEHIHRSLFSQDSELAPWAETAEILAKHQWNRLYDAGAIEAADPVGAAAVYYDDAYVPREFSMQTAALMPSLRTWVTSEFEHNGLRYGDVLTHLIDLAKNRRQA